MQDSGSPSPSLAPLRLPLRINTRRTLTPGIGLKQGASLQSVPISAGGLINTGGLGTNEHLPPLVAFIRRAEDKHSNKTTYRIAKMTGEELDSIKLQDGDTVEYPKVVF